VNHPYGRANAVERDHLLSLLNRLTDDELDHPMAAGWTVAGILAHLAFWDLRALALLRKWKQEGIGPSPIDTDIVNEAMREHCTAIPPRLAAELALSAAAAIDEAIEQLDAPMLAAVETDGTTVHLNRAAHRQMHLGEIEQALLL
jgi:hypothetical protein